MPATEPAHAKCTIWGVLLHHRDHELIPSSEYVAPPGRVHGAPHIYLDCRTCGTRVWDEPLWDPDAPRYREVFTPATAKPAHPGRIFYTVTPEDVGRSTIRTTEGTFGIGDVLGRVQQQDVGKRLYYVPCNDPAAPWIWQAENNRQRDARLAREQG